MDGFPKDPRFETLIFRLDNLADAGRMLGDIAKEKKAEIKKLLAESISSILEPLLPKGVILGYCGYEGKGRIAIDFRSQELNNVTGNPDGKAHEEYRRIMKTEGLSDMLRQLSRKYDVKFEIDVNEC